MLFDVNVPRRLRTLLINHEISTAQEQGWGIIENGELLCASESAGFEAFITADQNIAYQQNLSLRKIAIIVLSTNDWSVLKHAGDQILAAIQEARPGSFQKIRIFRL